MIRPPYPLFELLRWPWRWARPSWTGVDTLARLPRRWQPVADPDPPRVRLVVAGDVATLPGRRPAVVGATVRRILEGADRVVANLELAVAPSSARGRVVLHRSEPAVLLRVLEGFGVPPERWLLSVANNHAADAAIHGPGETAAVVTEWGGRAVGLDRRDGEPFDLVEVGGVRLGLVAWTRWLNRTDRRRQVPVLREDRISQTDWPELRRRNLLDLVMGFPHWGLEFCHAPDAATTSLARKLVRAGFDLILGHHPHVAQPAQLVEGALCLSSLGGFHGPLPGLWTWRHRMAWLTEVELGRVDDRMRVVGLTVHPLVVWRSGRDWQLTVLDEAPVADRRRMTPVVDRLFPPAPGQTVAPTAGR